MPIELNLYNLIYNGYEFVFNIYKNLFIRIDTDNLDKKHRYLAISFIAFY